jgi:hypothetical protein
MSKFAEGFAAYYFTLLFVTFFLKVRRTDFQTRVPGYEGIFTVFRMLNIFKKKELQTRSNLKGGL